MHKTTEGEVFAIGDVVHVVVSDDLLSPNHDLPADGWDAIVVDVDDGGGLEVAWLSRFSTLESQRTTPYKETWDDSTALVQPGEDATVTLLRRATYTEINNIR